MRNAMACSCDGTGGLGVVLGTGFVLIVSRERNERMSEEGRGKKNVGVEYLRHA